jgi:hydroxyacylglutathione hydrolase
MSYKILPIRALEDNYIWTIVDSKTGSVVIVDPGEAAPVEHVLKEQHLTLTAILITHHHWDHVNGVTALLKKKTVPVYVPARDAVPIGNTPVYDNHVIEPPMTSLRFTVIDIPGHTRGHVAYYGQGWVFTGDTLFGGGCGRIFEGTAEQLYQSLTRLSELDPQTLVYCGHEYTAKNLAFAQQVEPNNRLLQQRIEETTLQQKQGQPTLPSTIYLEKCTNPFLRCNEASIKQQVEQHVGHPLCDPIAVFAALRKWKDSYG